MLKFMLASYEDVCEINKIAAVKYPVSSIYIVAKEDESLLGFCVLDLRDSSANLLDVVFWDENRYILKVLLKAAFNTIDLSGIHAIYCRNATLRQLLLEMGFKEVTPEEFYLSLDGYFKCESDSL